MSTMTVRPPESLHQGAGELAQQEGISINQLVATAEAIDLDEGPMIHYYDERWQAELDTTCRRLHRYLITRERSAGARHWER